MLKLIPETAAVRGLGLQVLCNARSLRCSQHRMPHCKLLRQLRSEDHRFDHHSRGWLRSLHLWCRWRACLACLGSGWAGTLLGQPLQWQQSPPTCPWGPWRPQQLGSPRTHTRAVSRCLRGAPVASPRLWLWVNNTARHDQPKDLPRPPAGFRALLALCRLAS